MHIRVGGTSISNFFGRSSELKGLCKRLRGEFSSGRLLDSIELCRFVVEIPPIFQACR